MAVVLPVNDRRFHCPMVVVTQHNRCGCKHFQFCILQYRLLTIPHNNEPPLTSLELMLNSVETSKKHLKIAPHWPEANVEIQQFMDALIKVMRSE